MSNPSSITYVNALGEMKQRRHDVVFNYLQPLDQFKLLLSDPEAWLKSLPNDTGLTELPAMTLVVQDDPKQDPNSCYVRGMPATGIMMVDFNLSYFGEHGSEPAGGCIEEWIEGLDILVTIREDDLHAFVHLDLPGGPKDAEILFGILTNPQAIPRAISEQPMQVQYVSPGEIFPSKPVREPKGTIAMSFIEPVPAFTIRHAELDSYSCVLFAALVLQREPIAATTAGKPMASGSPGVGSVPSVAGSAVVATDGTSTTNVAVHLARDGAGHLVHPIEVQTYQAMQAVWAPSPDPGT